MPKVTIYIRNHNTREYELANPRTSYPQGDTPVAQKSW